MFLLGKLFFLHISQLPGLLLPRFSYAMAKKGRKNSFLPFPPKFFDQISSNASFTLSINDLRPLFLPPAAPFWFFNELPLISSYLRSASLASALRLVGTCTTSVTYWSPRIFLFRRDGTPLPFNRILVSVCVPGFTVYSTSPSIVLMCI